MNRLQELAVTQIETVFAENWQALEHLYTDDVRYRDPDGELAGRTAAIDHLRATVEALPGCSFTIRHCYHDGGDSVVVEWSLAGPEGSSIALDVMTAYDFLNEQIVSERNYWDNAALLAQLGRGV